jgi:phospholipid/cholesterol/gamma-HCH transport system substrate-binding protein
MKQNTLETIVGLAVLIVAGVFLNFAYNKGNINKPLDSYVLIANFENSEGISQGSDVKIAGIKVGYVEKLALDPENFLSQLYLRIDNKVKLPVDSKACVTSSGFLGGKFIGLAPGGADDILKNDGKIKYTQSSISLESLIGKFMYSLGSKD